MRAASQHAVVCDAVCDAVVRDAVCDGHLLAGVNDQLVGEQVSCALGNKNLAKSTLNQCLTGILEEALPCLRTALVGGEELVLNRLWGLRAWLAFSGHSMTLKNISLVSGLPTKLFNKCLPPAWGEQGWVQAAVREATLRGGVHKKVLMTSLTSLSGAPARAW